jgi:hypothetical protein
MTEIIFTSHFLQRVSEHAKPMGIDACLKLNSTEDGLEGSST